MFTESYKHVLQTTPTMKCKSNELAIQTHFNAFLLLTIIGGFDTMKLKLS